jgi:HupE / UreJ protein
MSLRNAVLGAASVLVLWAAPVHAHRVGEGYVFLNAEERGLRGRLEVTLADIGRAVALDADSNGEITQQEFSARYEKVLAYVAERIAIGANGRNYELRFDRHTFHQSSFGLFAQLHFTALDSGPPPALVQAEYRVLFDTIPNHVGYLVIESNHRTGLKDNEAIPSILFTPERPRYQTDLTEPLTPATFFAFLRQGMRHIWIGIDHILFVVALVMVSPLRRDGGQWKPVGSFLPALLNVAKIVSLFTVAHTITLTVAALGLVSVPSRVVESIIALSVLLAAVNIVYPIFARWTYHVVFVFGLFHGLGFASVLEHLTAARRAVVETLLGFNLGVEIGQLMIIVLAFPIVFLLRRHAVYQNVVIKAGALGIAAVACVWLVDRAFG